MVRLYRMINGLYRIINGFHRIFNGLRLHRSKIKTLLNNLSASILKTKLKIPLKNCKINLVN